MTPAARLQAAIEIMDAVIDAARAGGAAADTLVARYFASRRYAGSKDRRAVRELVYAAIRRAGEVPESGRAALIGLASDRPELLALFDGSVHGPAPLQGGEPAASAGLAPAWLVARLAETLDPADLPALLARAPLDIRANRLKTTRELLLAETGGTPGELAPDAIRLPEGTAVESLPAWREGLFEVQDEGSQLVAEACGVRPGMTVIDLCAGAGGKALALAATMQGRGRLIACDVDRARLGRLPQRAGRAGVAGMIEQRLLDAGREPESLADLAGMGDVVLVDAPCSGSGTWRRNPEARWRLTPERLARLTRLQDHVLGLAVPLVRPGGRLVYAVCSLMAEEGPERATTFLAHHPGWSAEPLPFGRASGPGRRLTPFCDGTDGFFVASLMAPC